MARESTGKKNRNKIERTKEIDKRKMKKRSKSRNSRWSNIRIRLKITRLTLLVDYEIRIT